jgi:hypothetical protein
MIPPTGYRAVYQGRLHKAGDATEDMLTLLPLDTDEDPDEDPDAEVVRVPIDELDEWYYFSTRCTYVGEPFQVMSEEDGQYVLHFAGGNGIKIAAEWVVRQATDEALGTSHWRENDMFTFLARVPCTAVDNVHEHHDDLLAARQRQAAAQALRDELLAGRGDRGQPRREPPAG